MDSENEKRRKKTAARLEAQEREKKELMAAGLNPYEVRECAFYSLIELFAFLLYLRNTRAKV